MRTCLPVAPDHHTGMRCTHCRRTKAQERDGLPRCAPIETPQCSSLMIPGALPPPAPLACPALQDITGRGAFEVACTHATAHRGGQEQGPQGQLRIQRVLGGKDGQAGSGGAPLTAPMHATRSLGIAGQVMQARSMLPPPMGEERNQRKDSVQQNLRHTRA